MLSVPSLPFPVILCTHFAEAVVKDVELVQKEPPKELSTVQSFPGNKNCIYFIFYVFHE